jgi:hypothetical protein
VIQPAKPDPVAALQNLRSVFPHRPEVMLVALHELNKQEKRLPGWRELQVKALMKMTCTFAFDVEERYRMGRVDQLATALRNLVELFVWAAYCGASEKNARMFCDDGPRDLRELMETLQKIYVVANNAPEARLDGMIAGLRSVAASSGFPDIEKRYFDVRDAAKEIGKLDAYGPLYKAASKFAHPTALAIHIGASPAILDALFVNGTQMAVACYLELEKFVTTVYPEIKL